MVFEDRIFTKAGKAVVAGLLSAMLAVPMPSVAFAATRSELEQQVQSAQSQWAQLSGEAEQCEYELITVRNDLRETEGRIAELDEQIPRTQADLQAARDELSTIVVENYKNGTPTLLDVVLEAKSFDDMVSRIVYFNKVAQRENEALAAVQSYADQLDAEKAELETRKSDQERLVVEQEERTAAAYAASESAEAYYNSLSEELKQQIAAEQAAAQQAALEAARQQEAAVQQRAQQAQQAEAQRANSSASAGQAQAQTTAPAAQPAPQEQAAPAQPAPEQPAATPEEPAASAPVQEAPAEPAVVDGPEEVPAEDSNEAPAEEESYTEEESYEEEYVEEEDYYEDSYSPSYAGSASALVSNAYSIIGSGYSYSGYSWTGSTGSSVFTCSGVVDFALGLPSQSNSPETLYSSVSYLVYDTGSLNYGDLVFYSYAGRYPGHVGIYIGDGCIIDSIPNGGVAIRDVNYMPFIGGGPIV